ncbi:unnamed protein product, partial [Penicillium discolor]
MWFAGLLLGKSLGLNYARSTTLAFTAAGNNFELAIAVAIGTFGAASGQALAGVVGPLIEVPVLDHLMNVTLTDAVDSCSPVATHAIGHEAASTVAATLKALSDPLRLRMLSAIASDPRGESCVCDLAELAHVSQPTVSHHLKVLKGVDVLTSERRGTWVWYRINPSRRGAVTALLDSFAPATMTAPGEDGDA